MHGRQTTAAQVFPDHHSAQVRQSARVTWITENSGFCQEAGAPRDRVCWSCSASVGLTCGPADVRPLSLFLQRLCQFAAERNLTHVVQEDRHDASRQAHQPGDADKITKLHKQQADQQLNTGKHEMERTADVIYTRPSCCVCTSEVYRSTGLHYVFKYCDKVTSYCIPDRKCVMNIDVRLTDPTRGVVRIRLAHG